MSDFHQDPIFASQTKVSYEVPSTIVFDRKFDTALRKSQIDRFWNEFEEDPNDLDVALICKHKYFPSEISDIKRDTSCYAKILKWGLSREYKPVQEKHHRKDIPHILKVVENVTDIQFSHMNQKNFVSNRSILCQKRNQFKESVTHPKCLENLLDLSTWVATLIEKSNEMYKYYNNNRTYTEKQQYTEIMKCNYMSHKTKDLKVAWSHTFCLIQLKQESWVLPKPYLLLIHNKLSDLISILVYASNAKGSCHNETSVDDLMRFLDILILIMMHHPSHYYTIVKALEAFVNAKILMRVDKWKNDEFFNTLVEETRNETRFDFESSQLNELLDSVSLPLMYEFSCLSKILGYPLVDMTGGSKSIYKNTHEVYKLNVSYIHACECYIKENYIRNSIIRFRAWPPHVLNYAMAPKALIHASRENKDPNHPSIVNRFGTHKIEDYQYVELLPNMVFSYLENAIPYLKDKTISLCRSRVLSGYIKPLVDANEEKPKWEETRLLLAFLLHPSATLDHTKYINSYEGSATLDDLLNYLVIRIVPKEKELKEKFRGFGVKTYEERFRALAQEKNSKKFLDTYCDEQAMTLGELELTRRLYSFRKLKKAYTNHYVLYITLDASSWNNHFRKETVDDIMVNTLDKIYDKKIWCKTQQAFQKTIFYVPDGKETHYWTGQAGGIEGLNQDTWVITYIAQIRVALRDQHDIKYHILCKGDDFRLAVIKPMSSIEEENLGKYKNTLVETIHRVAKDMGQKIKIDDSYGSQRFFNFSKTASVDLVELPQVYRKIQKCYGANNAFLPTLDEYIASSFSGAHSACRVNTCILACYIVAVFWSVYYLRHHPEYDLMSEDQHTALMLIPSLAGGFPIIYLHNMIVRAEADLLTPFCDLLQFTKTYAPMIHNTMVNFAYTTSIPPTTRIALYKDPYSIPNDRPSLPSSYLRAQILPVLQRYAKNEQILELIRASVSPSNKTLIDILDTASPCEAKVVSNLYSCLPSALLEEVLRKFESARSIYEFFMRTVGRYKSTIILRRTIIKENALQKWRSKRVKGYGLSSLISFETVYHDCSYQWAFQVRQLGWGFPVFGITMPCMQHQVYFTTQLRSQGSEWCVNNHFTIYYFRREDGYLSTDKRMHYQEGLKEPFLGYTTRTGNIEPKIHFIEKDVLLTKIKNVLDLVSWTSQSTEDEHGNLVVSNVRMFVAAILKLYTEKPLEDFAPFSGLRKSGTFTHHGRAPGFRESIVPNTLSNVYQHFSGETNSHIRITNSPKDHFLINFLHIYCYSIYIMTQELEYSRQISTPPVTWVVTTACKSCNIPIKEMPIVLDLSQLNEVSINPLARTIIDKTAEEILRSSMQMFHAREFNIKGTVENLPLQVCSDGIFQELVEISYNQQQRIAARYTQHSMSKEAYTILKYFIPQSSHRDISLTELKLIPVDTMADTCARIVGHQYLEYMRVINYELTDYVNCCLLPARSLPWSSIIDTLSKAGKLSAVLSSLCERVEVANSCVYENPDSVAALFGFLCARVYTQYLDPLYNIVLLSNYTVQDLTSTIKNAFTHHMTCLIISSVIPDHLQSPEGPSINALTRSEAVLVALILDNLKDSDFNLDRIVSSETCGLDTIYVADDSEFIDYLYDEDIPCEPIIGLHSKRLQHVYKINDNQEFLNLVRDDYDVIMDGFLERVQSTQCRIYVTTLASCILTIRNQPEKEERSPFGSIHKQIRVELNPLKWKSIDNNSKIEKISLTGPTSTFEVMNLDTTRHHRETIEFLSQNYGYSRSIHKCFLNRPWGYLNASSSHIEYIFMTLGIPPSQYLSYSVLGDGYGGCSLVLLKWFPRGRLLFNTLVPCRELYTGPQLLLTVPTLTSEILWKHLAAGLDDLREPAVIDHYIKLSSVNHVIVCDAEGPWTDEENHKKIMFNVLRYYFSTGSEDSILILKTYLPMYNGNLTVLSVLTSRCKHVYMISPPSIKCALVLYIVATGIRENSSAITLSDIENHVTFQSCGEHIQNMKKKCIDNWTQDAPYTIRLKNVNEKGLEAHIKRVSEQNVLPVYWITMVMNHLQINTPYPSNKPTSTDPLSYMKRFIKSFDYHSITSSYRNRIISDHYMAAVHVKSQAIDLNIRANRDHIINRWISLYGFYEILNLFITQPNHNLLTYKIFAALYQRFVEELPSRDFDPQDVPLKEYEQYTLHDDGSPMRYWASFCKGVNMALSLYGYAYYAGYLTKADEQKRFNELYG